MNTFTLEIQSPASHFERFEKVFSFSGRDMSGSFGILANAERRMTALDFGLASFKLSNGNKEYLALSGGLCYFRDNELFITTRSYVRDSDFDKITLALENEVKASETSTLEVRKSLRRLDEEILKRLSQLSGKANL